LDISLYTGWKAKVMIFVAVSVRRERNHGQLDVHAELELRGVIPREPTLDANLSPQLTRPTPNGTKSLPVGPA